MHIEIQVALNFVISYLYNKLPRRRVNIFGEELEKALKDKFQGHWYPEKPFKGSAFRCLKTGDPIDAVLDRAARESGVPVADILENLPNELSVWVDPGEVSYRIGEKGVVKFLLSQQILYSENSDNHEESTSADREVNKTFNPEAQCFRPIDALNSSLNNLSISPKTSPHSGSSPHSASSSSPTYKSSPNPVTTGNVGNNTFLQRNQASLTFTTATFAQTKFGSTKLKTSSKRASSSTYRMSPTEFSNYIKQRAMQQQIHGHGHAPGAQPPQNNHFGPIGPVSPARSLSPNPLTLGLSQNADPFYFPNMSNMGGMYPQYNGHRNMFDGHFHQDATNGLFGNSNGSSGGHGKFNGFLDPHGFYGLQHHQQQLTPPPANQQSQSPNNLQQQPLQQNGDIKNCDTKNCADKDGIGNKNNNINTKGTAAAAAAITVTVSNADTPTTVTVIQPPSITVQQKLSTAPTSNSNSIAGSSNVAAAAAAAAVVAVNNSQDSNSSKLMDGLNSFYSNAAGPYQQLLVAN